MVKINIKDFSVRCRTNCETLQNDSYDIEQMSIYHYKFHWVSRQHISCRRNENLRIKNTHQKTCCMLPNPDCKFSK